MGIIHASEIIKERDKERENEVRVGKGYINV